MATRTSRQHDARMRNYINQHGVLAALDEITRYLRDQQDVYDTDATEDTYSALDEAVYEVDHCYEALTNLGIQ